MVIHQLQVERRTGKVRRRKTDALTTVPRHQPSVEKSARCVTRAYIIGIDSWVAAWCNGWRHWSHQRGCRTSGPVSAEVGDRREAGKPSLITTLVNSALHPSAVAKSSTSFGWGKGGNVTSAGWQVTLCDPIWNANFRSGEAFANCHTTVLLLYFTQAYA